MSQTLVEQIAQAVLYEGYLLYPYRPSVKNRQRWTFGGLFPRSHGDAQEGAEPWMSQTECLVQASDEAHLSVRVRFLQLQERRTRATAEVWQEAVEREFGPIAGALGGLADRPQAQEFTLPARRHQGPAGEVVREQRALTCAVKLSAERVAEGLFKVAVQVMNRSPFTTANGTSRDEALLHSLISTHTILNIKEGKFLSMIDPPDPWRALASGCRNIGAWPVLVGAPGATDTVLAAPIILYDYPQIAPESPGDLFDSTEIDEVLTLRILTLTDVEKQEMARIDDRARALLERTEAIAREQLMGLHGTIRGLRPI